ncbi:uncharacterized protein F4807DRAFT_458779 [Annulohypoxylon truncatum]|uniref:uncharacterized protein n=1 Tax=Annulohypoxylon truncatum TaxID=327061 RepID=UPI002007FF30|nr:uncharacterized protein F4807DRAFT_458779 [Annulohypoxylon truncatum]KAI1211207.1 hypothetical protein F4807DRAFT_458779 [Annulohypoxylon truncatum]
MVTIRNWRKTKHALPDADPDAAPCHPGADGWVSTDGKLMCECGAVVKNDSHCISSHLTKVHNPSSAYQKTQFKLDGMVWACPDCDSHHRNWNALLAHYRRHPHDFRGDSSGLRDQSDPYKPESSLDEAFIAFIARARLANQIH